MPPLAGANELAGQAPPRAMATKPERAEPKQGKGVALGLAAAAGLIAAGGVAWLASQEGERDPESD